MATLQTLAIDKLMLRGKGNEFNGFGRMFKSLDEAKEALSSGDYVPVAGQENAVIVIGEGMMVYSFDIGDFVHIKEMIAAGAQANRYIDIDGVNDYVEFSNSGDVLDFTKDWSIGITFVGLTGPATSNKMTLFGRGGVQITLQALEIPEDPDQEVQINWGLYVTSDNDLFDGSKRAQTNTWYAPGNFSRIMLTYNSTTKRLKYHIGNTLTGVFLERANLLISDSMIAAQNITGGLCIGKAWTGQGGSAFSGVNWNGGLNNLILSHMEFTGPALTEYFQTGEAFTSMELYSDVVAYAKLGEDTYPNVTDEKGLLTGGSLVNGQPDDFKDMPTQ